MSARLSPILDVITKALLPWRARLRDTKNQLTFGNNYIGNFRLHLELHQAIARRHLLG